MRLPPSYPSLQFSDLDSMPSTTCTLLYGLQNALAATALASGNMLLRCLTFGTCLTSAMQSTPTSFALCKIPYKSLSVRLYSLVSACLNDLAALFL